MLTPPRPAKWEKIANFYNEFGKLDNCLNAELGGFPMGVARNGAQEWSGFSLLGFGCVQVTVSFSEIMLMCYFS
jgi:hypothetical protein